MPPAVCTNVLPAIRSAYGLQTCGFNLSLEILVEGGCQHPRAACARSPAEHLLCANSLRPVPLANGTEHLVCKLVSYLGGCGLGTGLEGWSSAEAGWRRQGLGRQRNGPAPGLGSWLSRAGASAPPRLGFCKGEKQRTVKCDGGRAALGPALHTPAQCRQAPLQSLTLSAHPSQAHCLLPGGLAPAPAALRIPVVGSSRRGTRI